MNNRYDDRDHPRGYRDEESLRPRSGAGWRDERQTMSPRDSYKGTPRHGDEHMPYQQDDRRRNVRRPENRLRHNEEDLHAPGYEHDRHDLRHKAYGQWDRYDRSGYDPEDERGSFRPDNDRSGRSPEDDYGRDRRRDRQASHWDDERHRREQERMSHDRGHLRHHDDRSHEDRSFDGRRDHGELRHHGERHDSDRVRQDQGRSIGGGRDGWRVQERNPSQKRVDRAGRDTEYMNDWTYEGPRFTRGGREVDPDEFEEYRGRDYGFSWRDGSNSATWRDMDRWGNEYSNHSRNEGFGYNRGSTRDQQFWSSPDRER